LLEKVEAMPVTDKRFEEMAAIYNRTECRCCRKDVDFFWGTAHFSGCQTAEQLLDALLANYRRVDRAEAAGKIEKREDKQFVPMEQIPLKGGH
jgi:hypothetical protein